LTDLPDSREPAREDNPLVVLCTDLILELNEKYADQDSGCFFLFHRHRTCSSFSSNVGTATMVTQSSGIPQ